MSKFVELATPLEKDVLLLRRLKGREELSRLGGYELDLLSVDGSLDLDKLLGYGMSVAVEQSDEERRYIGGYVTRIAQGGRHGRFHQYQATIHPWLWFLTRTSNCRIYQEMTVPDILKEVFTRHPVADVAFELTDEYDPWPYCVQYRETDFAFVSRLMEDEGIYYYFKHLDGRHTMVIADSYSAHSPSADAELPFINEEKFVRNERRHVSDWSVQRELQPGRYATTDFDFEKPGVALHVNSTFKREHALADYEIYDYPGDYRKRGTGEIVARTRMEELHAKFERVQGQTNSRALSVGQLFSLTHHTREDQNAEYLVVSTDIEIKSPDYESAGGEDDEGAAFSSRFSALRSQQPFRPERITPKPIVNGPQTAVIVGAKGDDIFTDNFGRVKVHFHWDRYDKSDDKSSCWIRVSQNWGGKGWGGMFIPHVGQEVIVEFLEGDPDSPLVTGRVYNADNMPPVALPAGKTQSVIRDHGANRIVLEGVDGKQKITMYSPTSNTWITMGDV
jgi:type VI secretion system secreted protein VgrG